MLKEKGIMNGTKTKMKRFETETDSEYSKRVKVKDGGSMKCAQIKGWGKARKR